jgi:hypothetical protein
MSNPEAVKTAGDRQRAADTKAKARADGEHVRRDRLFRAGRQVEDYYDRHYAAAAIDSMRDFCWNWSRNILDLGRTIDAGGWWKEAEKTLPKDSTSESVLEILTAAKRSDWHGTASLVEDAFRRRDEKEEVIRWLRTELFRQLLGRLGVGNDPDSDLVMFIRLAGEIWHLGYRGEKANLSRKDCQFLGWLAKLLSKPNHAWTMPELLGDPEGKIAADAKLGGERLVDSEGVQAIYNRLRDIQAIIEDTGGSEHLEHEQTDLLRRVEKYAARGQVNTAIRRQYKNVTTQKRQFLIRLKPLMPELTRHLKVSLSQSGKDFTLSYRPSPDTPAWHVEFPSA